MDYEPKTIAQVVEKVKKIESNIYLVGFKAEYNTSNEKLVKRAYNQMIIADMDMMIANGVIRINIGFGTDTNEVCIIDIGRNIDNNKIVGTNIQ